MSLCVILMSLMLAGTLADLIQVNNTAVVTIACPGQQISVGQPPIGFTGLDCPDNNQRKGVVRRCSGKSSCAFQPVEGSGYSKHPEKPDCGSKGRTFQVNYSCQDSVTEAMPSNGLVTDLLDAAPVASPDASS